MTPLKTHNTSEFWFSCWCTSHNGSLLPESNLRLWFILFATFVLHCPIFSTVVSRYLCKAFVLLHLPPLFRIFSTISVLVFLAFIVIPYCSQVASSLSIICWSCCSLSSNTVCVICITDVCDILSIDVYSISVLQCFSYQVFRVNVEHIRWQYTTLDTIIKYRTMFFQRRRVIGYSTHSYKRPSRVADTLPIVPISRYSYYLCAIDVSLFSEVRQVLGLTLGLVPCMHPVIKSSVMPPFLIMWPWKASRLLGSPSRRVGFCWPR